jgi:hypothetical protein
MRASPRVGLTLASLLLAVGAAHAATPTEHSDLPDRRAREAVARDLLYCGALYSGLSLKVPAGKRDAVANLGASLTASAATVLPDDVEFLKRELESVSNRVAAEIVDASGEKLGQLAQSADCKSYLQEDGINTAIRKRNAALNP